MVDGGDDQDRRQIIKAHSAAIQMSHKGTLVQHRAWYVLFRNAFPDLMNGSAVKHRMTISDLALHLGQPDPNTKHLKQLLVGLAGLSVQWNIFGKDGETEWGVASLLAGCTITRGVIEYDYSSFLREKLADPNMFALLNLQQLNKFKSKYSLSLYCLCKDYEGVSQTPMLALEKYRTFQGLADHEYQEFKRLATRVIKEQIEEINDISDIHVTAEYKRLGRKVIGVKFRVKSNPKAQLDLEALASNTMSPVGLPGATGTDADHKAEPPDNALVKRLMMYGVTRRQAEKLASEHDERYILENLTVVDRDYRAGKVNNPAAYIAAALRDDYRGRAAVLNGAPARVPSELKTAVEHLKTEYEAELLNERIRTLPKKERAAFEKAFLDHIGRDGIKHRLFEEGGLEHPILKAEFRAFVRQRLLANREIDKSGFRQFLQSKGLAPKQVSDALEHIPLRIEA